MKVCIIGSGISGLTSGAFLSKNGQEVIVFEQYGRIGGVTAPLEKEGYKWDLGQLLIGQIGQGEPVGKILDELGILDRIKVIKDDRTYVFPDFEILKPKEYEGIKWRIDKLKELFPEDSKGLDKYWKYYLRFMKLMTIGRKMEKASGLNKLGKILALFKTLLPFLPKRNWSAQKLMDYLFKSEKLQCTFISILADFFVKPSQFIGLGVFALNPEPFYDKRMPKELTKKSEHFHLFSVLGGISTLADALGDKIQEDGGKILTNCEVTKILVEDGKVVGLQTKDGKNYDADLIIASGGAKETFSKLVDKKNLTREFLTQVETIPLMDGVFMVHLGLDYDPSPHVYGTCTYFYGTYDIEEGVEKCLRGEYHEGADGFVVHTPSLHSPEMAPTGHHAMTIYTICPDTLREGSWEENKEVFAEKLLDHAEKYIPDLRDHIKVKVIMTPNDFKKRIHVDHFAFGGLAPIMGKTGISHETPIKNLWFLGAQSESGGSVQAIISDVYRTIKKIEKSPEFI